MHIEVAGNTIEVTVSLPGAEEITVILRDANDTHQSEKGTEVLTKINFNITFFIVQGSFGSVVFTDLPSGLTKVRAVGRGADGTEYSSEWYEVTV